MYIPDNYSRYQLEDKRLYETEYICGMCGCGFTDDEMSEDLNYCEACYTELKELEEEQNNEI